MVAEGRGALFQWNALASQPGYFTERAQRRVGEFETGVDRLPRNVEILADTPERFSIEITARDLSVIDTKRMMEVGVVLEQCGGLRPTAEQAALAKNGQKGFVVDTADARRVLRSLAGQIRADRIVKVSRRWFRGHVYNLQTATGWYIANGIIAHNCLALDGTIQESSEVMPSHPACRCATVPLPDLPGVRQEPRQTGAEWLADQTEETQRAILGKGGWERYQAGVPLSRFARVERDPVWGPTVRIARLSEVA